ncbi:MAG: serine/threonine-protein kinase, partial [Pirellulales bacterium]|nr:serine/threonine-protein kinase [Pirellulales bacterium]
MGIVYLAHDPHLDRLVALKVLPAELARDDERRKRFLREARSAAKLHHANAVTVYDVGVESGMVFIAMEYVDGGSLEKAVGPGRPMPCQEATRAIRDAAGGLAAAHEIGLVHRDVKPSNLLRTSGGVVKVADFGLARSQAAQTQLTQTGALMGTPAFMAPEQWLGQEADARTDLYSLVCTYYFLLTGQPPYEAESLASLGYQHHHQPFPDPRRIVPDIPEAVCQVLAKGAAKQAAERYPDAAVLVGALDGVLSGETATAARTDVPTPTPAAPPTEPTLIESPRPSPVTIPDAKLPAQPAAASRFGGRSFGRLVQDGIWRTVQRIDKLLARIAGEGNTLVHGFLRGACAGGLIVVVILLVIMPFVRSSVDEAESPVVVTTVKEATKSVANGTTHAEETSPVRPSSPSPP